MTYAGDSARHAVGEAETLARLKSSYEAAGYVFVVDPAPDVLPSFFGGYRPDAIARRDDRNIAFEIVGNDRRESADPLALKRLLESRPNWQHNVVVAPKRDIGPSIGRTSRDAIRTRQGEVVALVQSGHREVAFTLAWTLLEAALRIDAAAMEGQAMPAAAVVETLAMQGYIEPATERRIHPLVALRNRIVHGDLSAEVTTEDIRAMLGAIDETLMAEAT